MHSAIDRGDALAVLTYYQANRARYFAVWLAWAVGILRHAAKLRPDDEGLQVTASTVKSVLKKSTKDIFRLVITEDVQEAIANHGIVLTDRNNASKVVTSILSARAELTVDDLADCGLGEMDEQARDRLCDKLNAVLFRPEVDLSADLRVSLLRDAAKALDAVGEKEPFREALKDASRSGGYTIVAALMDGQAVDGFSEEEPASPEATAGGAREIPAVEDEGEGASLDETAGLGDVPPGGGAQESDRERDEPLHMRVIHISPGGDTSPDPGPLAA